MYTIVDRKSFQKKQQSSVVQFTKEEKLKKKLFKYKTDSTVANTLQRAVAIQNRIFS